MPIPRRTRAAVSAAALSTALVVAMAGTAIAMEDLDCGDFSYQEQAQSVLDADRSDPNRLDGGREGSADGVACESLPQRPEAPTPAAQRVATPAVPRVAPETAPRTPETTPPVQPVAPRSDHRGCPDFVTQADAQAALAHGVDDPERLDADDDGLACERYFGAEG